MTTEPRKPRETVRECAHRYGVTERTVWHWIDKGAVHVSRTRTPGGAVRVKVTVSEEHETGA